MRVVASAVPFAVLTCVSFLLLQGPRLPNRTGLSSFGSRRWTPGGKPF